MKLTLTKLYHIISYLAKFGLYWLDSYIDISISIRGLRILKSYSYTIYIDYKLNS